MAYNVHRLSEKIKAFDSRILSGFSEDFASNRPDHRRKIRSAVGEALSALNDDERGRLMNLDARPELEKWSVSISHCAALGGWIASPLPLKVGLDIEIKRRIHNKLIKRIAVGDELNGIPDPAFLWCAKESYFKALAKDQPVAITQLEINGWKKKESDTWTFFGTKMTGSLFSVVDLLVSVSLI